MKSGLAAMVAAASRQAGGLWPGLLSRRKLQVPRCKTHDRTGAGALLVSEPSSLDLLIAGCALAGHHGHGDVRASAGGGEKRHPEADGFLGRRARQSIRRTNASLIGGRSLAINTIDGGSAVNLTPDTARAALDIRTVPGMTTNGVLSALHTLGGPGITIAVRDDKPPVVADADDPFIATCQAAISNVCGAAKAWGGVSYFSDSCVLAPALGVPRAIIGPGELGMSGQRNEWVALDALYDAAIFGEIASVYLGD